MAKRLTKSASLILVLAALWAVPVTEAHACDSRPPQESPSSPQVSSESTGGQRSCFRRYDSGCDQARTERNRNQDD